MASRKVLREAGAHDLTRIADAYERWANVEAAEGQPNCVRPRPESELNDAIAAGLLFVLEERGGDVLAVAGVFNLRSSPDVYVELGGTYVDRSIRGYKLQGVLFEVRIATVAVSQHEARITTAINPSNGGSLKRSAESLFKVMQPIAEQLVPCKDCEKLASMASCGRSCCCDFYDLAPEDKRELSRRFCERLTDGTITLVSGDKSLVFDVECPITDDDDYRRALRDYVDGRWP